MPRDYAKKKPTANKKKGASRGKNNAAVPLSLWLFTFLLVSLAVAGLAYLKWWKPITIVPVVAEQPKPKKESTPKSLAPVIKDDKVPFYDVHHDLTNKKVEISKEDLKLPDNYKKYFYTMPCGSFREQERAEELKARIAMAGSNSELTAVQSKGDIWYRVQLGPFTSKRTAEKTRHRMEDNNIQGCLINQHIKAD